MELNECPGYAGCTAPICPLDKSFKEAVWYVDEPFCMARAFRKEHWRRIQKRIVRVNAIRPVEGFFNFDLLNGIQRVAGGIKGLTERQGVINPQERDMILSKANGSSVGTEVVLDDNEEEVEIENEG